MDKSSKSPAFSVRDFFKRFPDDEACLTHIMEVRFGMEHECRACGEVASFHRMSNRRAYACAKCGDHLYPTAGTVFEDTRTPLQLWFYAIYLFVTTRHGVSGKELQRSLGVTYKTAWRMGHKIRELMAKADGFEMLAGHVEMDEAYVGGRRPGKRGRGAAGKTIVMGMVERNGKTRAKVIPNVKKATLREVTLANVEKGSVVSTDELIERAEGVLTDEGLVRLPEQRAPAPLLLPVAHVPKPEDYVLARSEITLDDIYEAGEWSHIPTRLPAPEAPVCAPVPLPAAPYTEEPIQP